MVNHSKDIIQVQGINSQGYGIIPKMVMQDKRLTIQAKAIYGYFCSYAGAGKTAFPGRKKIMADLRVSKESYYKHFNLLKECGYIEAFQEKDENGAFCRNVYTLVELIPCPKNQDSDEISPCPKFRDTDFGIPKNRTLIITVLKLTVFIIISLSVRTRRTDSRLKTF